MSAFKDKAQQATDLKEVEADPNELADQLAEQLAQKFDQELQQAQLAADVLLQLGGIDKGMFYVNRFMS